MAFIVIIIYSVGQHVQNTQHCCDITNKTQVSYFELAVLLFKLVVFVAVALGKLINIYLVLFYFLQNLRTFTR